MNRLDSCGSILDNSIIATGAFNPNDSFVDLIQLLDRSLVYNVEGCDVVRYTLFFVHTNDKIDRQSLFDLLGWPTKR